MSSRVERVRAGAVLREEMSGVYTVDVSTETIREIGETWVTVDFVCDPKQAAVLEKKVLAVAAELRRGNGADLVEPFRAMRRKSDTRRSKRSGNFGPKRSRPPPSTTIVQPHTR